MGVTPAAPHRTGGVPTAGEAGVIAAGAAFLLYVIALRFGFVWDDPVVLLKQLPFSDPWRRAGPASRDRRLPGRYYRRSSPSPTFLDRSLWGDSPFGFHLSVVLLHALTAALVILLGLRLFGEDEGWAAAMTAGLLFRGAPGATPNRWPGSRGDPTAATAFALGRLARLAETGARLAGAVAARACSFSAGLSKENALGWRRSCWRASFSGSRGPGLERIPGRWEPVRPARRDVPLPLNRAPPRPRGCVALAALAARERSASCRLLERLAPAFVLALTGGCVLSRAGTPACRTTMRPTSHGAAKPIPLRAARTRVLRQQLLFPLTLDVYVPSPPNPPLSLVLGIVAIAGSWP